MDMAERVARVETEVKNIKETNTREHSELKDIISGLVSKFDSHIMGLDDRYDKRYASKGTEKVMKAVGLSVVMTIVGAILTLIIK